MKRRLNQLPRRTAMSYHWCRVCLALIEVGEDFYDGGYGRRAHVLCGDKAELDPSMERSKRESEAAFEAWCTENARRVMTGVRK